MQGNSPVRFGKRPTEKDPNHGHLASGLFHSEGGHAEKDPTRVPRRVAYPAGDRAPAPIRV
jgi:hypothetical protein